MGSQRLTASVMARPNATAEKERQLFDLCLFNAFFFLL
jgi:hypothetical protein